MRNYAPQNILVRAFNEWHADNPHVYAFYKYFTFQAIKSGRPHYSSDAICHRIRWHTEIETTGEDWKMNNNYAAFYARKFMADYPQHKGFFRTRKSVADPKGDEE